jgi:hypothetical protein
MLVMRLSLCLWAGAEAVAPPGLGSLWVASEGFRHVANEFRPFGAGVVVLATEA